MKLNNLFRFIIIILITALTAIAIKGCSLTQSGALKPFKVGLNNWAGYQIALYAKEAGLFRKHGLDVEFVKFLNQQDNIRATMRGSQDASFIPLPEVMQVDTSNDKPVVVMVVDISAGSDGIAASPDINSVKDLKGKKVSAKFSTVSHLILLEALQANQMKPEDVEVLDVINERAAIMLKKGEISAATLWQPLLQSTAKDVGGKVIYTTADVDSLVIDAFATRTNLITTKQDELVRFMKAWFDAIADVETKPQEVFASIAKQLSMTTKAFAEDYKGLKKGDLAMNRRMFEGGRLQDAYQKTRELLLSDPRHGRDIRNDIEINGELVKKASNNWQGT